MLFERAKWIDTHIGQQKNHPRLSTGPGRGRVERSSAASKFMPVQSLPSNAIPRQESMPVELMGAREQKSQQLNEEPELGIEQPNGRVLGRLDLILIVW